MLSHSRHPFALSRFVQQLDIALYALCCPGLATALMFSPPPLSAPLLGSVVAGLALWTLLEYLLHRFVLHGLAPFSHWHAQHHRQPRACIGAPPWLSLPLFGLLLGLPTLWLAGRWVAVALLLGVLGGYLAYALLHQALHLGGAARSPRLRVWRRRHAQHHRSAPQGSCYGVTNPLWDWVFGSGAGRR